MKNSFSLYIFSELNLNKFGKCVKIYCLEEALFFPKLKLLDRIFNRTHLIALFSFLSLNEI